MQAKHSQHGFSLTELVIAVAIIGILAAVAYPSYQDSIQKSRRADAKAALLELAQFMERTFIENKSYTPGGTAPTLPFTESPKDSGSKFYDLTLAATVTTFTVTATPKGPQSGDSCGTLTFTHAGQKGVSASTVANCW